MIKIRQNIFETNSSSSHAISIKKLDNSKNGYINFRNIDVSNFVAASVYDRTRFIYSVLCRFVCDYVQYSGKYNWAKYEYLDNGINKDSSIIKEIYEDVFAFKCVVDLLKSVFRNHNIKLYFDSFTAMYNPMTHDEDDDTAYNLLFFSFNEKDFKDDEKVYKYFKSIKEDVTNYIFDDYILTSVSNFR